MANQLTLKANSDRNASIYLHTPCGQLVDIVPFTVDRRTDMTEAFEMLVERYPQALFSHYTYCDEYDFTATELTTVEQFADAMVLDFMIQRPDAPYLKEVA